MSIVDVVIVLLCAGLLMYGVQVAPFIAAPYKQIITWIVIVAVVLWLVSLTGILAKLDVLKFPHV